MTKRCAGHWSCQRQWRGNFGRTQLRLRTVREAWIIRISCRSKKITLAIFIWFHKNKRIPATYHRAVTMALGNKYSLNNFGVSLDGKQMKAVLTTVCLVSHLFVHLRLRMILNRDIYNAQSSVRSCFRQAVLWLWTTSMLGSCHVPISYLFCTFAIRWLFLCSFYCHFIPLPHTTACSRPVYAADGGPPRSSWPSDEWFIAPKSHCVWYDLSGSSRLGWLVCGFLLNIPILFLLCPKLFRVSLQANEQSAAFLISMAVPYDYLFGKKNRNVGIYINDIIKSWKIILCYIPWDAYHMRLDNGRLSLDIK